MRKVHGKEIVILEDIDPPVILADDIMADDIIASDINIHACSVEDFL